MPKGSRRTKRGRPGALARFTLDQIKAEIDRRRDVLMLRRSELQTELHAIEADLAGLGENHLVGHRGPGRRRATDSPTSKRRGRGGNKKSLPALLHSLLGGSTMSVPEMADAAKKAGHKSKSKNFRMIVSLALLKNRSMFKRVSRGQYTAR